MVRFYDFFLLLTGESGLVCLVAQYKARSSACKAIAFKATTPTTQKLYKIFNFNFRLAFNTLLPYMVISFRVVTTNHNDVITKLVYVIT